MTENDIGHAIITAAMKLHPALGPGLPESASELCLVRELTRDGPPVQCQVSIPIRYDDLVIENGYRLDPPVSGRVVVEAKALEAILPVHRGRLLGYLRLGGFKLGYLLDFTMAHMRDGITRLVNGL